MSDFGIPGWHEAHEGAVLLDRGEDRARWVVEGRAPEQMLTGILSGRMPPASETKGPASETMEPGITAGLACPSTVLTPKGKLVTVVRVLRMGDAFLLDLPAAGAEPLAEHFKRYLPPRMAKAHDRSQELGHLTVVGPRAAELLTREALGLRVDVPVLDALEEGEWRELGDGAHGGPDGGRGREPYDDSRREPNDGPRIGIRVVRSAAAVPPAFDVIAERTTIRTLRERLEAGGAVPGDESLRHLLRMERGRPEFGVEIDRDTLPPEAGLDPRAIDHHKGCYTGQEVIVRIRDRGRVNRHLRGLLLGDALPEPGTELWIEGRDRSAGEVRSAVRSPRFDQGIALAMVRREAEPPTTVRLGAPDGPEVQVRALDDAGWVLDQRD